MLQTHLDSINGFIEQAQNLGKPSLEGLINKQLKGLTTPQDNMQSLQSLMQGAQPVPMPEVSLGQQGPLGPSQPAPMPEVSLGQPGPFGNAQPAPMPGYPGEGANLEQPDLPDILKDHPDFQTEGPEDSQMTGVGYKLPSAPKDQNTEDPTAPIETRIQNRILDTQDSLNQLYRINELWDDRAFSGIFGKPGEIGSDIASKWDAISGGKSADSVAKALSGGKLSRDDYVKFHVLRKDIQSMALLWRKFITGVAGGEKEMEAIMDTTLNEDLSPDKARAMRDELFFKYGRDAKVYRSLLEKGITPETAGAAAYNDLFLKERGKTGEVLKDYTQRFLKANKGASKSDAVMFYLQKQDRPEV